MYEPTVSYVLSSDAEDGEYQMPAGISMEQLEQKAKESAVRIQINARPEVWQGSSSCNLMIGNPAENRENLKIKVILDETGETIFESAELKPGDRIPYVTLDIVPKPGEHLATATFIIQDPESRETIGAVDTGLLMTVYQ